MHTLDSCSRQPRQRNSKSMPRNTNQRQSQRADTMSSSATGATDNTIQKDVHLSRRNVTSVVKSVILERRVTEG